MRKLLVAVVLLAVSCTRTDLGQPAANAASAVPRKDTFARRAECRDVGWKFFDRHRLEEDKVSKDLGLGSSTSELNGVPRFAYNERLDTCLVWVTQTTFERGSIWRFEYLYDAFSNQSLAESTQHSINGKRDPDAESDAVARGQLSREDFEKKRKELMGF